MPGGRPRARGTYRTTSNRVSRTANRNRERIRRFNGPQVPSALDDTTPLESSDIGDLTAQCVKCQALHFPCEQTGDHFTACCHDGKVPVQSIKSTPLLQELFSGYHPNSKDFIENIRQYNSALSFTSLGANYVPPPGFGPYCFRVQGTVYHIISDARPKQGSPQFGQLYILDCEEALAHRVTRNPNLNSHLLRLLSQEMDNVNPFARLYKSMDQVLREQANQASISGLAIPDVGIYFNHEPQKAINPGRQNLPRVDEVAAVFVSGDGAPPSSRSVAIYPRTPASRGEFQTIDMTSQVLDPLSYPMLRPFGEAGWHFNMRHLDHESRPSARQNKVTYQEYVSSLLAVRPQFSAIHRSGKLFQQLLVDYYCRIEGIRLRFLRGNQSKLRVETYVGLADALHSHADHQNLRVGRVFVLPSSFTGSPRNMNLNYQDAMALVREFGRPDLFITFTCNGNWREIKENTQGQHASMRPDIVCRIFNAKLKQLLDLITKKDVFGKVKCYVYTIEFQKRGLPHCHLLVTLEDAYKLREVEDVDRAISAELPDRDADPELFDLVSQHMMHGPCGDVNPYCVCMNDGVCTKKFPRAFRQTTRIEQNGYPLYRRRDDGWHVTKHSNGREAILDNRHVVPHNRNLLRAFKCHINVELCCSIKSVKYLHKYIMKGHDVAAIRITNDQSTANYDEITTFQSTRFVGPTEAAYRIFKFPMHGNSHWVIKLDIYLPSQQQVYFTEGTEEQALARAAASHSMLSGWFSLNQADESARNLLYTEIPANFIWNASRKKWISRQRGQNKVIARLYTVSPKQSELWHLRLLLLRRRGCMSFEDIYTVDDVRHPTFKEAASALGLLADDSEWECALREMISFKMPRQLRSMFAYICAFEQPTNALSLWEMFKDDLSEDFESTGNKYDAALNEIRQILTTHSLSLEDIGLPAVSFLPPVDQAITRQAALMQGNAMKAVATPSQRAIIDEVLEAVEKHSSSRPNAYFIDGPGGSGKTFVYQCLINLLTGSGDKCVAVAWTGIAAMLLPGGRTVHNRFRLPLNLTDETSSGITYTSADGNMFRNCKLIIWDEAPMASGASLKAIDRFLRFITGNDDILFGGKIILLGGDFRQVLPVVARCGQAEMVLNSIKMCTLWPLIQVRSLTVNMRTTAGESDFAEYLLRIGDGREETLANTDLIRVPQQFIVQDVVEATFGTDFSPEAMKQLSGCAILAPKNGHCDHINHQILDKITGDCRSYKSIDSVETDSLHTYIAERMRYPVEFLNSLNVSGLPPHDLRLKKGSIVILLRNLNVTQGLMNGTRLQVIWMRDNCLDLEVLSGTAKGDRVFLPRIDLTPSNTTFPFLLKRRQFPVKLAFAMSINKSQGQTLDKVGLYLPSPVFSHGQLYVAMSRVRSGNSLKIQIENSTQHGFVDGDGPFTRNVVASEMLQ